MWALGTWLKWLWSQNCCFFFIFPCKGEPLFWYNYGSDLQYRCVVWLRGVLPTFDWSLTPRCPAYQGVNNINELIVQNEQKYKIGIACISENYIALIDNKIGVKISRHTPFT